MDQADDDGQQDFDGSPQAILRFLRELVDMTGDVAAGASPVLRLQFGDVDTVTSLAGSPQPFLCIAVHLPRRPGDVPAPPPGARPDDDCTFLWDAGEGRYMMLRKVGIAQLPDERSVFDAILEAKDRACGWFASARSALRMCT